MTKTIEIDEEMYQLVADDQVIGETEKNNICDALESIKSQKVKLDFLRSSVINWFKSQGQISDSSY